MLHYAINVTSSEAEFFAIRCGINQATHLHGISKIIVVMDSIHAAKNIFNPSSHPLQKHVAFILNDFREFFYSSSREHDQILGMPKQKQMEPLQKSQHRNQVVQSHPASPK